MSGHLPNGTHINPKFSGMHINPNFKTSDAKKSAQQIHVNPKFVQNQGTNTDATTSNSSVPKSNVVHINPKFESNGVHINPKFANRALPPLPGQKSPIKKAKTHVNPSFLDGKKAKAYEEAIKMAVESKVHVKVNICVDDKVLFQFLSLSIKFGNSEKNTKWKKVFHVKFDATITSQIL